MIQIMDGITQNSRSDRLMHQRTTQTTATATDNVSMAVYDIEDCYRIRSDWDQLTDDQKLSALRSPATEIQPLQTDTTQNTTCIGLDEYRVANLNEAENANEPISELALGTDSTAPAHADRSLTNEHARTDVAEFRSEGQTLTTSVFLAKAEANGEGGSAVTLTELGLYAGPYFLNHSLFTSVEKSAQKAVVFEIDLTFGTA